MKIALVQKNLVIGDLENNVTSLLTAARDARAAGADLAVFSELSLTGYPPRDLLDRPAFVDDNLIALERFAREAEIPAIIGFVDRAGSALYNAAAAIEDGRVTSIHHKALLPTYDVFDEHRYFTPGGPVTLAKLAGVRIGISICEDIWNDAAFWRHADYVPQRRYARDPIAELADLGAQVLVNISASPFATGKRALRPRMLAAQAQKHRLPLVMVNQVGGMDDLIFDGVSMACSATGAVGARAAELSEDVIVADLDLESGEVRGDLRDPAPSDAAAIIRALSVGTRDYVEKCGFSRVAVGLSGGIDSAVTCAIAVRALGADRVLGVAMPSRYSSEGSLSDARALAENLAIRFEVLAIDGAFQAFLDTLAPIFAQSTPGIAEENVQARCRAVILMALSNKLGHLVLSTGNKSELAVGYCTLYGDMAGGLGVLADVTKTQVYAIAEEINRDAGRHIIPRSTIDKPPSAELAPDQRDQDSLPPYPILDAILERIIERGQVRDAIIGDGFEPALVDQILTMVRKNEYKRTQAALGLKIRARAFGRGRRLPLAGNWRDFSGP